MIKWLRHFTVFHIFLKSRLKWPLGGKRPNATQLTDGYCVSVKRSSSLFYLFSCAGCMCECVRVTPAVSLSIIKAAIRLMSAQLVCQRSGCTHMNANSLDPFSLQTFLCSSDVTPLKAAFPKANYKSSEHKKCLIWFMLPSRLLLWSAEGASSRAP